jgi:mRNA-degrading endonuclease RelE of RelBE toxin-antitoxin system
MEAFYTERFQRDYSGAPREIQRSVDRKVALLLENLRHPSLHAKKYAEADDLWQARITGAWRFYFRIEGARYVLISMGMHK